ncbi:hypothetical protein BGW39_001321 [Mortierella sp. 14UC]|nr:hypothetical protein BGW39_001321 [Mortierella sp. 14UC]
MARRRLAFAQYNNALYIQGGFTQKEAIGQLSSLDLTTAWTTTRPAWTTLALGPVISHHSMVAVKPEHGAGLGGGSKGYLLSIGGNPASPAAFWVAYDFEAGAWKNIPTAIPGTYTGLEGHTAVSDPDTGLVYVVGGFYGNTTQNLLTVFDPKTASVVSSQPATDANNRTDVAAVWSTRRKTVLTFGGSRAITAVYGFDLASLQEYDPSSNIWKTMTTTGTIPTRRLDSCAAASEDGSKIVVFGGSLDSNTYFDTIYVLDVITGVWTQGASAPAYRTRMACGFMAGQFVVFGGSRGANRETTMHDNIPLIYDPDHNIWSTGYDPAGPVGDGTVAGGEKSNTGVIAGAAGGAVAVILAGVVAFFVFRRRRQNKDKEARDSDARIAASVSDEDERQGLEYRFDPVAHHKKYMHANALNRENSDPYRPAPSYSEAGGRAGQMSAMDHYAAAAALQAPLSPGSSSSGGGGRGGAPPRIHSTYSDAYTQSTSENDYAALTPMNNGGLLQPPLPSGSASPMDPELYHQQQLHLQQLQLQHQQQPRDLRQQLVQQQQLYHSLGVASVSTPPTHPDTPMTPFTYSTTGATGYPSGGYEYNSIEAMAAAAAAGHAVPATSALNETYSAPGGRGAHPYDQQQQQQHYPSTTQQQPPQQHYLQQQQEKRGSVVHGPQSWTDSIYETQSQVPSNPQSTPSHPSVAPMATQLWMPSEYHPSDSGAQYHQQKYDNNDNNNRASTATTAVSSGGGPVRSPQGIVPQTPAMPPRIGSVGGSSGSMSSRPGGDLGYVPPPR